MLEFLQLEPMDVKLIPIGFILVSLLYFALSRAVFKPILAHVEAREDASTGAQEKAEQMQQKAQALKARYEDALFQARVEANRERAEIVARATAEAQAILSKAERDAQLELSRGRATIERDTVAAQARLEVEAAAVAETLVHQVDTQLTVH
jgi:F-type H+-transporting ATPase subunit b